MNQTLPDEGDGTAASCDTACRDDFKNRTLLINAASPATLVLDRLDLWDEGLRKALLPECYCDDDLAGLVEPFLESGGGFHPQTHKRLTTLQLHEAHSALDITRKDTDSAKSAASHRMTLLDVRTGRLSMNPSR